MGAYSTTWSDEDTLFKVAVALKESGLNEVQTKNAINEMLNAGILFREMPRGTVDGKIVDIPPGPRPKIPARPQSMIRILEMRFEPNGYFPVTILYTEPELPFDED